MLPLVPNMKPYNCQVGFLVLMVVVHTCTLDADNEDSECSPGIEVRRHTVYNVSLGQELRIICPVAFCNNSPPKVSWSKIEGTLPFNISRRSDFITKWKTLGQSKGEAYLIIQHILENDAGVYRCEITGSVSHFISVYVSDDDEPSAVTTMSSPWFQQKTTLTTESPPARDIFWHYMHRIFGILAFVVIVSAICVISKRRWKGKAKNSSHPGLQDSHHIYDNDL